MDTTVPLELTLKEILPYVGEYGRFQRLLVAAVFIINIPAVAQIMILYFSTLTPSWKCVSNSTICTLNGTLSPQDLSKCDMPRTEWYFAESNDYSLVTTFDIFCDDEWLLHLTTSIFFIGWALGAIVLGWSADRYGRKIVLFISIIIVITTGIISPIMPHISLVIVIRFLTGFFYPGVFIQSFVLISELLGENHREKAGLHIFRVYPIAWSLLALKAYFTKNWKVLSLVATVPYCFILLFYKFVPESPEWLEARNKKKELTTLFDRIATWNKKKLPDNLLIKETKNEVAKKKNLSTLFSTRKMTSQSVTLMYLWFVINMVYYGLQMAANDMGGSIYRDFVILALVSLPANFLSIYICKKMGRKKAVLLNAFGGGMLCMALAFIPPVGNLGIVRIVMGFLGKLLNTVAYTILHSWSAKLYPVTVRSGAVGVFTAIARVGATSAPWITKGLKRFAYWLPFAVLAAPLILGACLGIWLPESEEDTKPRDSSVENNTDEHNV